MAGKFSGYALNSASNRAAIAHAKGYFAARVREAAEEEIQEILKVVEQRIRNRLSQAIDCRIGDIQYDFDPLEHEGKLSVRIHIVEQPPKAGSFSPKIDLGTGRLGPARYPE